MSAIASFQKNNNNKLKIPRTTEFSDLMEGLNGFSEFEIFLLREWSRTRGINSRGYNRIGKLALQLPADADFPFSVLYKLTI